MGKLLKLLKKKNNNKKNAKIESPNQNSVKCSYIKFVIFLFELHLELGDLLEQSSFLRRRLFCNGCLIIFEFHACSGRAPRCLALRTTPRPATLIFFIKTLRSSLLYCDWSGKISLADIQSENQWERWDFVSTRGWRYPSWVWDFCWDFFWMSDDVTRPGPVDHTHAATLLF